MQAFGFQHNKDAYSLLARSYSEKHRFYHTGEHISACLMHLDDISHEAEHPYEIEVALWFHDVVYKPQSFGNEIQSARLASDFMKTNAVSDDVVSRVHRLIMATLHDSQCSTKDESLLVDIDLSIFGSADEIYSEYSRSILQMKPHPYSDVLV